MVGKQLVNVQVKNDGVEDFTYEYENMYECFYCGDVTKSPVYCACGDDFHEDVVWCSMNHLIYDHSQKRLEDN